MTEIYKVMQKNKNGDEEQVYPEGTIDSIIGLRTAIESGQIDVNGIANISFKYTTNNSYTTAPTSWNDSIPAYSDSTPFLWTQLTVTYTNGVTKTTTYPVNANLATLQSRINALNTAADGTTVSQGTFQTLRTQVNNSAVGTNLFIGTKDFDNLSSWADYVGWTILTDTYKGLSIVQTDQDWEGLSQYIQVSAGETYTFSVYARYTSGTGTSTIFTILNNNLENGHTASNIAPSQTDVSLTSSWQRVSFTFTITSDGWIKPRIERTSNTTNTLQICGMKLEKGSHATDWSANPTEILTQSDYAKIKAAIVALGGSLS